MERIRVNTNQRTRRPFLLPDFKHSPYEGYAVRYVKSNFWRCAKTLGTWDDAMSEAAVVYYRCRRLYGSKVDNGAHFMALFKQVLFTHFTDLANKDTKYAMVHEIAPSNTVGWYMTTQTVGLDGELPLKLRNASTDLQSVLNVIMHDDVRTYKRSGSDYFKKAIAQCGFPENRACELEKELRTILA